MSTMKVLVVCAAAACLSAGAAAAPVQTDHAEVELVSETAALVPGHGAWLGLRIVHEPHWHTYWINPGDSGLATKLSWNLPPGFAAGDVAWPTPQRFDVGGLFNFGYDGEVLLPVRLEVPAAALLGSRAALQVEARWLVCREECVPGKAMLALDLPVASATSPDSNWREAFAAAHAAQPQIGRWNAAAHDLGDRIEVTVGTNSGDAEPLPGNAALDAFVVQRQVVAYTPPQISRGADALRLTFAKSEYFTSVPPALDLLLIDGAPPNARAWRVHAPLTATQSLP